MVLLVLVLGGYQHILGERYQRARSSAGQLDKCNQTNVLLFHFKALSLLHGADQETCSGVHLCWIYGLLRSYSLRTCINTPGQWTFFIICSNHMTSVLGLMFSVNPRTISH